MTAAHVHGLMVDLLAFRKRQAAPFGERAAAFVAGLRALTRQTGVAVTSTVEGGAYYFEMVDAADCPRGQYLQDGTDLEWQADSRDYAALRAWEPSGAIGVLDVAMSRGVATATDAASKALFEPVDCGRMGTLISVRVPSIGPVTFRADENPMPYGDRVERHGEANAPPSTTTPERAAWARLVAAHIGAANAARGQSIVLSNLAAADVEGAEQSLRDLGVDAHALILEAIGDPNLFR